ncbi:DUF397 domain-containing protein [Paractinoplanes toevensis]|uniref:DUF397 domain-containing protein n=1 Tax=Paractinoplanes toevensis TaxID=571911 RepID=A0A920BRF3_9ACTN|nr:DUF397 domain-containing protein [Actinoplanes toevensis]GIM97965.1 hypothetical protein Ato02nite_097580 [Actinoplanes toevensis]
MNTPDPTRLKWRKSTHSDGNGGSCVEVADLTDGGAAVRDTKDKGAGPILWFTAAEWDAFLGGVKDGEFDQ